MSDNIKIKIDDDHSKRIVIDMIDGNISRLCVSDDTEELERMEAFAIARIRALKEYRLKQLKGRPKDLTPRK